MRAILRMISMYPYVQSLPGHVQLVWMGRIRLFHQCTQAIIILVLQDFTARLMYCWCLFITTQQLKRTYGMIDELHRAKIFGDLTRVVRMLSVVSYAGYILLVAV